MPTLRGAVAELYVAYTVPFTTPGPRDALCKHCSAQRHRRVRPPLGYKEG